MAMQVVGQYTEKFNILTGQALACGDILQSDGLINHVRKRHPACVSHISDIPNILSSPDYIGHHPREPESVELVKRLDCNLMFCVKLDSVNGYFFVASLFEISDAKLQKRIDSGRLVTFR